jgi:hypothetical protein
MPTPTYVSLATITLGSTDAEIIFSSIPATYRDLVLVFSGTSTTSTAAKVQVNADTASNYSFVRAGGTGSTTFSSSSTINHLQLVVANAELSSTVSNSVIQMMDYSATDKHKSFLIRENNNNPSGPAVLMYANRWANTAAINQIRAFTDAGAFAIGSTFSLYGIAS